MYAERIGNAVTVSWNLPRQTQELICILGISFTSLADGHSTSSLSRKADLAHGHSGWDELVIPV